MSTFWPGALTLPFSRALIALADTPLAAPSANTSTTPNPTKAEHVFHNLSGKVRVILDGGPCNVGIESTVVDGLAADGCLRVLRPGGVTVDDMQRALAGNVGIGQPVSRILVHRRDYQDEALEEAPTTPGMKYRHYSPLCTRCSPHDFESTGRPKTFPAPRRVFISYPADITVKIGLLTPSDSSLALLPSRLPAYAEVSLTWHMFPLGPIADLSITAQRLFDRLLTLEREGVDLIIVEGVDEARKECYESTRADAPKMLDLGGPLFLDPS
ncbi:DHBP synthase RibB-like alpha/beta domain-containing protein [Hysterangium stoloniferum]|nr:DHBP synthase RibB-like alpha/beta domain-containing protein [Hysterangium stoloniferum]